MSMRPSVMHYAGDVTIIEGNSVSVTFAGFTACCSGDRAVNIAKRGNHTLVKREVTCKKCRAQLRRAAP